MSRRRSPFRIVLLGLPGAVLVAVLVASLPGGCPGSGGPGGASLTAALRVQPNTDPDDPLVCRLDNGDLGTALVYGSKDDTGRMTGLAALEYWAAGETSVRITFDDRAWPTQFISADGAQVALTYTDATVTAHWHDGQGTTGSATFDLPAGARAKSLAAAGTARASGQARTAKPSSHKTVTRAIVGDVKAFYRQRDLRGAEIRDGVLVPRLVRRVNGSDVVDRDFASVFPTEVRYNAANNAAFADAHLDGGSYRFYVTHRTETLEVSEEEARAAAERVGFWMSAGGTSLSVVGTLALPGWVSRAISGVGAALGIGSLGASEYASRSEGTTWAGATPGESARVYARLWYQENGRWLGSGDFTLAEYDGLDASDPVVRSGFTATIDVPSCAGVRTDINFILDGQFADPSDGEWYCAVGHAVLDALELGCVPDDDPALVRLREMLAATPTGWPVMGLTEPRYWAAYAIEYGCPRPLVYSGYADLEVTQDVDRYGYNTITIKNVGEYTLSLYVSCRRKSSGTWQQLGLFPQLKPGATTSLRSDYILTVYEYCQALRLTDGQHMAAHGDVPPPSIAHFPKVMFGAGQ